LKHSPEFSGTNTEFWDMRLIGLEKARAMRGNCRPIGLACGRAKGHWRI
jgi:hypothetical protein